MHKIIHRIKALVYQAYTKSVPNLKYESDQLRDQGFFSQNGQDKYIVENIFHGKNSGYFLDIGAYNGITFSNSFYLEKNLGWKGIAVEPSSSAYEDLKKNRKCNTIQGCVADFCGKSQFQELKGYTAMLSGLVDKYDKNHIARVKDEMKKYGGELQYTTVPCFTVEHILSNHNIHDVDFMSIDTEGGELDILRSIDSNRFNIKVICVENNYQSIHFRRVMKRKGYRLAAIVGDEIYIKQ